MPDRKKIRSGYSLWLRKAGTAALTSVLFYFTFVYLHAGRLFFEPLMLMELSFVFLFLLSVFWSHGRISAFMRSAKTAGLPGVLKKTMEGFLVVVSTLFLLAFVRFLPELLLFPELDPPPGRIRVSVVVSTIISLFFYYFVERERSRKQLQAELLHSAQLQKENFQAQLQSLKTQVNPHFLFNSLNVLGSLIHKDQEQAVEFVRRLSDVYRAFLDHSHEMLVSLEKEMELVQSYIYLLKTRFGDNLRFEVDIPVDSPLFQLPPGSLQMLLENAVKHNGSTARRPLFISIRIERNKLVVCNKLQPRQERVHSTKTGLSNIISRYQFLTDEEVDIEKTADEFIVRLPLLIVEEYESGYQLSDRPSLGS